MCACVCRVGVKLIKSGIAFPPKNKVGLSAISPADDLYEAARLFSTVQASVFYQAMLEPKKTFEESLLAE